MRDEGRKHWTEARILNDGGKILAAGEGGVCGSARQQIGGQGGPRTAPPRHERDLGLVDHVDGFLSDGVEGGNGLGIGLESPLRNDQVGELGGDVDVGHLEG